MFVFTIDIFQLIVIALVILAVLISTILILISAFKASRRAKYLKQIGYTRAFYSTPNTYGYKDKEGKWAIRNEREINSLSIKQLRRKYS